MPRKMTREQAINLVPRILETSFWLSPLRAEKTYSRVHDDHDGKWSGSLDVHFDQNGDAYVWISSKSKNASAESLRFRMPFIGGGASPRTRTALMILALAMELDEEEFPQKQKRVGA